MYWVKGETSSRGPWLEADGEAPNLRATNEYCSLLQTLPNTVPVPPALVSFGLLTDHLIPANDDVDVDKRSVPITDVSEPTVPSETLRAVRYILASSAGTLNQTEKRLVGELCEHARLNRTPEAGDDMATVVKAAGEHTLSAWGWFETASVTESAEAGSRGTQASAEGSTSSSDGRATAAASTTAETGSSQRSNESGNRSPGITSTTKSKSGKHSCPRCGKSYRSEAALRSHRRKRHAEDEDDMAKQGGYECPHCESEFEKKHRRDVHKSDCVAASSGESESGSTPTSVGKSVTKDGRGERVSGKNPFADPDRLKDTGLHQGGG